MSEIDHSVSLGEAWGWRVEERFGIGQLRRRAIARAPLKSGEVRVRLTHSALNYRDLMMVEGAYNPKQPLPLVPCSDGVGVVEEVSAGSTWRVGDRVIPIFAQGWRSGEPSREITRTTLGGPLNGTLRTEAVFHSEGLVRAPSHLTNEEASTLGCAALTAWSALVELGAIRAGEHVLCIGTGGVSLFAAQIAALSGARVTLTSRSEEKLNVALSHPELARFGSLIKPFHTSSGMRWGREVKRAHGEADHVVEVGGAGTLTESLSLTRPGGTVSLIGVLAGGAAPLNLTSVLMRQIKIQGVIVGHREGMKRMITALERSAVRPVIGERFTLDEAPQAFNHLQEAKHIGKIVLSHP